jgi:hypothetical protein
LPAQLLASLIAKFILEGKMGGCGAPGRLPLICRFSRPVLPVGSISQWRTFILVNFDRYTRIKVHALSFR